MRASAGAGAGATTLSVKPGVELGAKLGAKRGRPTPNPTSPFPSSSGVRTLGQAYLPAVILTLAGTLHASLKQETALKNAGMTVSQKS